MSVGSVSYYDCCCGGDLDVGGTDDCHLMMALKTILKFSCLIPWTKINNCAFVQRQIFINQEYIVIKVAKVLPII